MSKYLPKITDYRNEVVFILGAVASIALAVQEIIAGIEVDDVSTWAAAVPVLLALAQRRYTYGPETVKRDYVER